MGNALWITEFDALAITGTTNKKFQSYGTDTSRWANRSYIVGGGTDKVDYDLLAATSRIPGKFTQPIILTYTAGGANAAYAAIRAKGGVAGTLRGKDVAGSVVSCTARLIEETITTPLTVDRDTFLTAVLIWDLITVWA